MWDPLVRLGSIGAVVAALAASVAALGLGPGEAAEKRLCLEATIVDGRLLCDEERPRHVRSLCGRGPDVVLRAGDRLDCTTLRHDRMAPADLQALAQPVDVNTADVTELDTLPGVGPTTAQAIVEGRPFATVEELDRVRGIGPTRLSKLRARARVHGD